MYLFTYGTLKKGFCNHELISNLEYIGEAITCKKFQMYPSSNYPFPFVIKSEQNHFLLGEVYKLNSKKELDLLDSLEGYPTLYLREEIEVKLNNKIIKTIIYLKNEDEYKDFIDLNKPILEWTKDIASSEL